MEWFRHKSVQVAALQPTYPPLKDNNSIRLLLLSPASRNDPLSGELLSFFIPTLPRYEALSYTWGTSTKRHTLSSPSGGFLITPSLQSALKRLRYIDRVRMLWVDALCINQSDNEEKSRQILLMPKIFATASRVVVYLGDEFDGSEIAIDLIEQVGRTDFSVQAKLTPLQALDSYGLPQAGSNIWVAFRDFWRRPWFRRVWIIQEFLWAKDVTIVCGEWEKPWQVFLEAAEKTLGNGLIIEGNLYLDDKKNEEASEGIHSMVMLCYLRSVAGIPSRRDHHLMSMGITLEGMNSTKTSLISNTQPRLREEVDGKPGAMLETDQNHSSPQIDGYERLVKMPLILLIDIANKFYSTNPRDRLFAVLSLSYDLNDQDLEYLRPNYTKNVEWVICRYASFLIRKNHCLEILYKASTTPGNTNIPSWTGDWTAYWSRSGKRHAFDELDKGIYQAAGNSELIASVNEEERILKITGGFVDTIKWTLGLPVLQPHTGKYFALSINTTLGVIDHIFSSLKCYPTGESLHEVKWRSLIANRSADGKQEAPSWMGEQFLRWRTHLKGFDLVPTVEDRKSMTPPEC